VRRHDELQDAIESLGVEIGKLEAEQRRLQTQQRLFPTCVTLKEKEAQLVEVPETPLFHEDALTALEKLKAVSSNLETQTDRDTSDLEELEQMRGRFIYDDKIIAVEPSIISLQKKSEQFRSASKDVTAVRSQRATLGDSVRAKIERLGPGWTEERVRRFNLSLSQEDQSRTAKEEINEAKRSVESIRSKLEAHRDSRAAESARGIHVPAFVKNTGYVSTALGVTGIILGFVFSEPLLSVFSACLLIVGLIVGANARKASKTPPSDPLERKYAGDLLTAESTYVRVSSKWQGQLKEIGLDESLSPDGALDVMRTVREIQSDLASAKELDSRIESMQDTIEAANNLLNQVVTTLGKTKISDDTVASIEILTQQLGIAKEMKGKKESLEERITELMRKVKSDKEAVDRAREELQQYFSTFGAKDEADFQTKYDMFRKRETLKQAIDESKTIIRSAVGTGEEYESFITSISLTNPGAIAAALETTEVRLKEFKTQRDQKNQTIGELRIGIKDLSSKDLIVEQTELEIKKQQLRDGSADWVRSRIALFALEKAISRYENTRQPEVIKAAAEIFARITNHAYSMVIKPAEINPGKAAELSIQDSSAKRKTIGEMSRGTKEQLYLAMRLGLIRVYETKLEPMPIIMDDILANFDDNRGPEAIKALIEFSNGRQVIVLTCHNGNLDLFKSSGAKEIRFD
jgi:uncharacterized protein YhaN